MKFNVNSLKSHTKSFEWAADLATVVVVTVVATAVVLR